MQKLIVYMNYMENTQKQKPKPKRLSKSLRDDQKDQDNENCTKNLKEWMTSTAYMLFMSVLTIYSIFAIDIDKGFFNHDASVFFSSVHVVSMMIFSVEIVVTSIVQKDYLFQFHFWIDIFSTLMMMLQLIWIEDLMNSTDNIQVAVSFARVSKASRFSKIGGRSTKIMKLIRLIKLMKLFRKKQDDIKPEDQNGDGLDDLENSCKNQFGLEGDKKNDQTSNDEDRFVLPYKLKRPNVDPFQQLQIQMKWQLQSQQRKNKENNIPKQEATKGTKVGEILKYQIQKNIVIMVMSLIMIVPLLSASTWFNKTQDMEPSTGAYFSTIKDQQNASLVASWCNSFIEVSINSSRPIIYFSYQSYIFPDNNQIFDISSLPTLKNLRQSQETVIEEQNLMAIYSKKQQTQITSWINMIRSVLIIVLLLITSIMFVKDLQTYALTPLQKMSATVSKIEKNPFSVLQSDQEENEEELIEETKQEEELQLQTNILQKFFIKITSLLALGVGQTPLNSPTQLSETKQNIFDQPISTNVEGIFVCIQLADLNQLIAHLQDKSSGYINLILQIFHETAIENGGYIFHQDEEYSLICWKVDLGLSMTQNNIEMKIQEKRKAELAFLFYLQFCERVSQSAKVKQYEKTYQFIANQQCKFHLGFHCGVAYCGTIGSQFKLSLKAIGKDITIVKSLCRAAGKNKVQNLVSSQFANLTPFINFISRKMQELRYVESFRISSIQTFSICGNISLKTHSKADNQSNEQNIEQDQRNRIKKMLKFRQEMLKNSNKSKAEELTALCKSFLKKNANIDEYLDLWRESCNQYDQGQWGNAKTGYINAKECNFKNHDLLTEKRLLQIGNREQPPSNWTKQVPFSLFL